MCYTRLLATYKLIDATFHFHPVPGTLVFEIQPFAFAFYETVFYYLHKTGSCMKV